MKTHEPVQRSVMGLRIAFNVKFLEHRFHCALRQITSHVTADHISLNLNHAVVFSWFEM